MMWTPFKTAPKPIKITKDSLLQFAKYRKIFLIEDAFTTYLDVYKTISIISNSDEESIRQQVEKNINLLVNERVLQKNGKFFHINSIFI